MGRNLGPEREKQCVGVVAVAALHHDDGPGTALDSQFWQHRSQPCCQRDEQSAANRRGRWRDAIESHSDSLISELIAPSTTILVINSRVPCREAAIRRALCLTNNDNKKAKRAKHFGYDEHVSYSEAEDDYV